MSEEICKAPADASEMESVRRILIQAFGFPAKAWETYVRRVGQENFRVQKREGRIAGALAIYRFGHFFGGRRVSAAGIAAVGVPPEERRGGVGLLMMQNVMRELRAEGLAVSSLYPATIALYRRAGYELAGANVRYKVPTPMIRIREAALPVARIAPERCPALERLCLERAVRSSGNLDRSDVMWERLTDPREKDLFAYVFGDADRPEGFILFHHESVPEGYDLMVRDWVASTPRAARQMWSFVASHATQTPHIHWTGPAVEPLVCVLPEIETKVTEYGRWMLRILDPVAALSTRGYPPAARGELHLTIQDDLFPESRGPWTLTVEGGRGTVRPGGPPGLTMDVRALAALYTGFLQPAELETVVSLDGPREEIDRAAAFFQAPDPWMADYF